MRKPIQQFPEIVSHAACAVDNPLDSLPFNTLADRLEESYGHDAAAQEFMAWVRDSLVLGAEHQIADTPCNAGWSNSGLLDVYYDVPGRKGFAGYGYLFHQIAPGKWKDAETHKRKRFTTLQVLYAVYSLGGLSSLLNHVVSARIGHLQSIHKDNLNGFARA